MATLNGEWAALLKGKNFAVVATIGEDDLSQLTTNWIDWDGEHVVFSTAEGRVKPRNIRRNPIVSVCVFDHENPYRYLSVTGPAEISDDGAEEHINDLSRRYVGRDFAHIEGEKRLIVRVKPERVFARSF